MSRTFRKANKNKFSTDFCFWQGGLEITMHSACKTYKNARKKISF